MTKSYQKPEQICHNPKSQLANLFKKAERLNFLQAQLQPLLDSHLQTECRVANYMDETLILAANSGVSATAIRLQSEQLIQRFQCNAYLQAFKKIHCKVCPPKPSPTITPPTRPILTSNGRAALLQVAEEMTDTKLKASLEKLASRAKKDV